MTAAYRPPRPQIDRLEQRPPNLAAMVDAVDTYGHPFEDVEALVKPIQPYQARKAYACPGCETVIPPGMGHVVVVPTETPDLRRHWHRGCWFKELRRRGVTSPHPL